MIRILRTYQERGIWPLSRRPVESFGNSDPCSIPVVSVQVGFAPIAAIVPVSPATVNTTVLSPSFLTLFVALLSFLLLLTQLVAAFLYFLPLAVGTLDTESSDTNRSGIL